MQFTFWRINYVYYIDYMRTVAIPRYFNYFVWSGIIICFYHLPDFKFHIYSFKLTCTDPHSGHLVSISSNTDLKS